jgi:hypothetical protein
LTTFLALTLLIPIGAAEWKDKLKADIESTWQMSKVGFDRIRITQAGTVFVIRKEGITGDLANDGTFTRNSVEKGRILAPKGAVAFLQNKKTSRPFKAGEKVYLWKVAMDGDELALFLISHETFSAAERGGRTLQTRYKILLDFKFERDYLPTADFAKLKSAISEIIIPESELQAAPPATISLGQSTAQVQEILGKPERIERIVDLGAKVTYVYKDMKIIFVEGKVADVQ